MVRVGLRSRAAIAVITAVTAAGDSSMSAAVSWSGEIAARRGWRRVRWVSQAAISVVRRASLVMM